MIRIGTLLLSSRAVSVSGFILGTAAKASASTGPPILATTTTTMSQPAFSASTTARGGKVCARSASTDTATSRDVPTQKWDVNRYQSSHSFVWKYGSSLLELIDYDALANVAGTSTIRAFDVGCGSGQLTKLLHDELAQRLAATNGGFPDAKASLQVFGMDLDPDMIKAAQDQFPEIRFFVGDARNVELPSFDDDAAPDDGAEEPSVHLILSNAALHWIPPLDIDRAVKSISQVLVPGGQFVVEFGGRDNLKTIVKAMKQVFPPPPPAMPRDNTSPYFHDEHVDMWYYPSIADFTGRLAANRIEVTSAALFDRPTLLDNGDDGMENWIRMFGSKYWRHLGLSQQEIDERIKQAVELLRPQLYDPATGQWTADYRRIRIVGRKLE